MEKPPANAGTASSTDRALNPLRINGARHTLRTTDRAVFTQEIICSADRSHELLPLIIPGLPAPRRLPWPAAVPAGGRPIETRRPSRVTAARSAISSVGPVCSGSARATDGIPIESRAADFIPPTTSAWRWRGEAAHHIQTSPRAPWVRAANDVEAGAQGTDEAVTSVHGPSAKSAVWAEAALPRSSSEATPCTDWRFRSARAAAAASGLKIQGLSTTWRR